MIGLLGLGRGIGARRRGGCRFASRVGSIRYRSRQPLARAHLSARPIVILDEATCHLDPAAEERAERAFMETGATLIVVAHRMSATLRAQQVLVMATDGVVIGSHDDLLQSYPLYADLHAFWSPGPQASTG